MQAVKLDTTLNMCRVHKVINVHLGGLRDGVGHSKLMNIQHFVQIFTMYSQAICALFLTLSPFHLKLWVGLVISVIYPPHMVNTEIWKTFL